MKSVAIPLQQYTVPLSLPLINTAIFLLFLSPTFYLSSPTHILSFSLSPSRRPRSPLRSLVPSLTTPPTCSCPPTIASLPPLRWRKEAQATRSREAREHGGAKLGVSCAVPLQRGARLAARRWGSRPVSPSVVSSPFFCSPPLRFGRIYATSVQIQLDLRRHNGGGSTFSARTGGAAWDATSGMWQHRWTMSRTMGTVVQFNT